MRNCLGLRRSEERNTILFSWGKFNTSRLPVIKEEKCRNKISMF